MTVLTDHKAKAKSWRNMLHDDNKTYMKTDLWKPYEDNPARDPEPETEPLSILQSISIQRLLLYIYIISVLSTKNSKEK